MPAQEILLLIPIRLLRCWVGAAVSFNIIFSTLDEMIFLDEMRILIIVLLWHLCVRRINIVHRVLTMKPTVHLIVKIHFANAWTCIFLKVLKWSVCVVIETKTFNIAAYHRIIIFKVLCHSILCRAHLVWNVILVGAILLGVNILRAALLAWWY